MRILRFVLILTVSILLKNVYCDSSNPLPNAPLSALPETKASPKQLFFRKNIGWEGRDEFLFFLTHEISNKYTNGLRPRRARTLSGPLLARSPPPPPPVPTYVLAVQWPPGVCCTENSGVTCKINPVPTEFTIHGLWPQPNGPQSNETFDANKIENLTSDLIKYWPDLKSKRQSVSENEIFWKEEWDSRGKYSGLGVHAYFENTLDLFKNAGQGLKAKLATEKITPTISNTYKLKAIQDAVTKINGGFSGTIICGINKHQIQEIQFRYTNGFQKQDNLSPSNCNPEILFPSQVITSYTLAVQWPRGVCTGKSGVTCKINPVPTEFTIHGLWPQPKGAPATEIFTGKQIATLTSDLIKYWPDLKSKRQSIGDNIVFWQDEWLKHGKFSCLGVKEYFEKSLQLHKDAGQGLKAKLATENIRPDNKNTYKLVAIQDAVKKINGGFSGTIICVASETGNVQQIQEIRFSYKQNFDKQDNSERTKCGADVWFPA